MDALSRAVEIAKGQAALASAIGVKQQHVWNWLSRGRVPAEHCPAIERATAGAVRCEELRPDVAWGVLREQVEPTPEPAKAGA
ncbi:Cro/Cl family transcriptional regulator [Methylibium sp. Pch-M]|uniref:helix-turn-helix domain-containing protein n=1 Tax=Methylibium sp. Pch-M TaxID=2082386 RepID=UPI001011AC86|nr:helix-turn-helix domain-containing protein [Methylibium sp. Pch-M]QAZ38449.1 Cro/Cl family transcriptional regulator [Methylibium sp. Pch-M]